MDWTDESISRLRDLWQEGHSTAEIGRRMQITKNAVVGKAHRLTLPPRPSPIRKTLDAMAPAPRSALPVLRATAAPGPARTPDSPAATSDTTSNVRVLRPVAPASARSPDIVEMLRAPVPQTLRHDQSVGHEQSGHEAEAPAPVRTVAPNRTRRGMTCCWPLGDPGTKSFSFCGGEPIAGKPYCGEHAALAYVKIRDRRDSVA
ncbi:GcrA family cell cycle regulator [Lichenicola sp.]|uniref:GcrA family cell cycle regulator n=1 Tax=Lichenicola sp. TaxID=2804529 RepID=UPI003B005404